MAEDMHPSVCDHAVLRYLERVEGIDVTAARLRIEAIVLRGVLTGASAVRLAGHTYVLEGRNVTTVLPRRERITRKIGRHVIDEDDEA